MLGVIAQRMTFLLAPNRSLQTVRVIAMDIGHECGGRSFYDQIRLLSLCFNTQMSTDFSKGNFGAPPFR
ncbi:MAG: hypothetical protein AAFP89_14075 [Bacteroidota bacterium]